ASAAQVDQLDLVHSAVGVVAEDDVAARRADGIGKLVEDEVAVDDLDLAGDFEARADRWTIDFDLERALPVRAEVVVEFAHLARHGGDVARGARDLDFGRGDLDGRGRLRGIAVDPAVEGE